MTTDIIEVVQERLKMLHERELLCADECRALSLLVEELKQQYIKLPLDADGVPIRTGDTISYREMIHPHDCDTIVFYDDGEWRVHTTDSWLLNPIECRHVKQDTVESLLEEFSQKMTENIGMYTAESIEDDELKRLDEKTIADYAERIRKVAER